MSSVSMRLIYWPMIPGRGEFVRLVLEAAGAPYVDVARHEGWEAVSRAKQRSAPHVRLFAPPILEDGDVRIAQMALICQYVGEAYGLAPADEALRWAARAVMFTVSDAVQEVHNLHHPISTAIRYEDQSTEAQRATQAFVDQRLPMWLDYVGDLLARHGAGAFGDDVTYVDLALDQLARGLDFALPAAMSAYADHRGLVVLRALQQRVADLPRIAAYRGSERCIPFSEHGIFRYYPDLDLAPAATER